MRNCLTWCVLLFAMAGTALSKDPKPAEQGKAPPEAAAAGTTKGPPKELTVDLGGGMNLEMLLIPAGSFMMGDDEKGSDKGKPVHKVTITKPFYLGKYEVTQEQWEAVMGKNPNWLKGPKNPVELVSWDDCQKFLGKLNAKAGGQGGTFSLPTEAQWEYACRAGSTTRFCYGDAEAGLGDYAWYAGNSGKKSHPVGEKKPNAWGLYDMHGNVWEWCADYWLAAYAAEAATDPRGPATGTNRVTRGGCWSLPANFCRSTFRSFRAPAYRGPLLGLRVARVAADK